MKFTKEKRLLTLIGWTIVLALIYFPFQNTPLTMPITYTYFALCLILSVLYVLVTGGIAPILQEDRKREEKSRGQYLRDKGNRHPAKQKERYRRCSVKGETAVEKEPAPLPPRANPLKLSEEKQTLFSQILLVSALPFYFIFLIDWMYLFFFVKG